MIEYTERLDGFQIRDVTYLGSEPINAPIKFDVVKWYPEERPYYGTVFYKDNNSWKTKEQLITEHCYSVGFIEWNDHEKDFDFRSVGLRWLEEKPSDKIIDMILKFCEDKRKELYQP